jgi:antitoxin (DNA-binding transcriptional repressor) of toxin-antitoxin stability system
LSGGSTHIVLKGASRTAGIDNSVQFGKLNDEKSRIREWCIMNVAEAEKRFGELVNKVYNEGISVDLERDDKVIARLTPAKLCSPLTVGELNAFLRSLPPLGDDADEFAQDIRAIRAEFPAEANPWD